MGYSSYSNDDFDKTVGATIRSGGSTFTYSDDVKSGKTAAKVHDLLDPSKPNSAGQLIRESRDSEEHPNSRAIAIILDETGSMSNNPKLFVAKLGGLMEILVKRGFLADPQILFCGVGDATSDKIPLQIGQFESGNEMDSALTHIVLEGNGGGTSEESYDLPIWFLANFASMDCVEKRGEKGYLFIIGDERVRNKTSREEVRGLVGINIQDDIPLKDSLAILNEKFEVFWIMPNNSYHHSDKKVNRHHKDLWGQRFFKLEDPNNIVELIATTIGLNEGFDVDDIYAGLKADLGSSNAAINATSKALALYKPNNAGKMVVATVEGALVPSSEDDDIVRL